MGFIFTPITFAIRVVVGALLLVESVFYRVISYLKSDYGMVDNRPYFAEKRSIPENVQSSEKKNTKRIRVLLEIDVEGSDDARIVTATEVIPKPPFFLVRWYITYLEILLRATRYVRISLEQISRRIEGDANTQTQSEDSEVAGPSNGDHTAGRKMKSPRKRLSESKTNASGLPSKLKLLNFFGVFDRSEPATVSFVMPSAEELQKLNNARNSQVHQPVEKRKLSVSSDDSETPTANSPSSLSDFENSETVSGREKLNGSTRADQGGPGELKASHHRKNLVKFMDNDDEQYDSSEDPNYTPNEAELNASSTTNETLDEEERIEELNEANNGSNGTADLELTPDPDNSGAANAGTKNEENAVIPASNGDSASSSYSNGTATATDASTSAENGKQPEQGFTKVGRGGRAKSSSKSPRGGGRPSGGNSYGNGGTKK